MKFYLFSIVTTLLLSVGNVNASNHQVIDGDSEYGKTLVESAFGRGCMGCHSSFLLRGLYVHSLTPPFPT